MADTLKDLKKSTTTKKSSSTSSRTSTSSTSVPARHYESIAHFAAANKAMSYKKKKTRDRHMAEVDAKDWTIQGAEKSSDELFRKTPNVREYTVTPSARQTTSTGTGRAGASGTSQRGNTYTESRERLDALLTQKSGKPANDPATRTTGGRTAQQEKLDQYMNRLKQVNAASKRPEEPKSTTAPEFSQWLSGLNGRRQTTGGINAGPNMEAAPQVNGRGQQMVDMQGEYLQRQLGNPNSRMSTWLREQGERNAAAVQAATGNYDYGKWGQATGDVEAALQKGNVQTTSQDLRKLIASGYFNGGDDYTLMNESGLHMKSMQLHHNKSKLEAKVTGLRLEKANREAGNDADEEYENQYQAVISLYRTPETENERRIINGSGYSDEQKETAQGALGSLYDQYNDVGENARDRTEFILTDEAHLKEMLDAGDREGARRYVYDYMNSAGAYDQEMGALDQAGRDALNADIDNAIGAIIDKDYDIDQRMRNAQAELEYTDQELGNVDRLYQQRVAYRKQMAGATGDADYDPELDDYVNNASNYGINGGRHNADYIYHLLGGNFDTDSRFSGTQSDRALLMNDDERKHFMSLYKDGKKDEAWAFYEAIQPALTQVGHIWEQIGTKRDARVLPVFSTAATFGAHVAQPIEMIRGVAARRMGDPNAYDPNGDYFTATRFKTQTRAAVGEDLGTVGKFFYDTAMSAGDSAINAYIWKGIPGQKGQEIATLMTFAAQSYETSFQQNMQETNGNYLASAWGAFLDSLIETGTEIWSVEKLLSDPTNFWNYARKLMVSEGSEEFTGATLGPIIKGLLGSKNEWRERANQILVAGGYTDAEGNWVKVDNIDDAMRQSMREWNHDIFISTLSGAMSVGGGVIYGGGQNIYNRANMRRIGANVNNYQQGSMQLNGTAGEVTRGPQLQQLQTEQDVINNPQLDAGTQQQEQAQRQQAAEGLKGVSQETTEEKKSGTDLLLEAAGKLKSDSRSAQLADSIRDDQKWGRKVSDRKIGELAVTVAQESNEEARGIARDVMAETATGKLVDSGMGQGESWVLGQAISKAVSSEEGLDALSKAERKKLEGSEQGMAVFNEMNSWAGQEENAEATALQEKIGAKSRAQAEAMGLVEEVAGYDNAKVNAKRATNADVGEQLATEEEIKEAGGNATRSSDEVIVDGGFAKITGMETVDVKGENGQKRTQIRYTIEQNGQKRTVTAGEVKATNFATAALMRENDGNANLFGARYTQKMLEQMQRGNVTDVSRFLMSAERIRFAAYAGMDMPKTSLPQSVAFELYNDCIDEHRQAMEEEAKNPSLVKNTRGAGNGIARFDGVEYGTAEWSKKVKNVKNPAQRAQIQLVARVAKAMGAEVTITRNNKQVDVYGYESQQEIGLNLSGKNFSNGQAAESHSIVVGFGHEATHWLQRNAPEAYRKLRTYVLDTLQKQGKDVGLEVQKMFEDRSRNENITIDGAIDEIVADACDQILGQEETVRHIQQTDQKLAGKLREFVRDLVDRFKKAIAGMSDSSSEYSRLMKDNMNELVRLWTGAYDEALSGEVNSDTAKALQKDLQMSDGTETHYGDNAKMSRRVTSQEELNFLNNQKTIKTYKSMQLIDGKLYPPMAAVVAGNMEDASELGQWEKATEHPELIKGGNKFTLNKGKGKGSLDAAYNPYMHSSNLMINDQFSGAWNRPNLVTVECEVPSSELDSGYHAEFAKDSVGWHSWHTGPVASLIRNQKGTERQVFLSRWIKPVRIVENAEVAQHYAELLKGTDIAIPDNVITPALREELEKAGVPIKETGKVRLSKASNYDYQKSFEQQIDDVINGVHPEREPVLIGMIPKVMKGINLPQLPLAVAKGHINEMLGITSRSAKIDQDHVFGEAFVKNLPNIIADPVAIIESNTPDQGKRENSIVMILAEKNPNTGNYVVSAVEIQKEYKLNGDDYDGYMIDSVHGRKNAINMLINAMNKEDTDNHGVFYFNNKKASVICKDANIMAAKANRIRSFAKRGFIHNINDQGSTVKTIPKKQTDTIQFENWFKGSKIVDENNEPLVVYHGTSEKFTIFEMDKTRSPMDIKGAFFSPWEIDAAGYGENVGAFYLSIKNPAPESVAYKALNMFKGQKNAGEKARDYLIKKGYDGVNNSDEEYIAFYPEQIKSATDNVGTFNKKNPDYKWSRASANVKYEQAVESGNVQRQRELVDQAAKAAGYTMKVYHGTPNKGFTEFRGWNYFTENKEYADRYQTPSASSIRGWYNEAKNPGTFELYMNPGRVFDTRNAETQDLFEQMRQEMGMTQLQESGLPDWTDGRDIVDYIEENNLPYDTILLDEGGDGGYGEEVRKRGISYMTKSNQVKSAEPVTYDNDGNVIPLSERFNEQKNDIRWSKANVDAQEAALWSAEDEARTEWNRIREENKGLKAETDRWVDRILEAQKAGNEAEVMDEYYEWEKGFTAARAREQEAEQKVKAAHKAVEDYIEQRDVAEEQKKIRESGLSEADYRRKQAANEFGYTSDFREAGYMLPNGKMLNFTGEKGRHTGSRGQDHRAIETIYASRDIERGKAMVAFMTDGNIRVMAETPGIDISSGTEPTREQYAQIRSMARRFAGEEYFNIDFTDERGNTVDTIEYDGRVNPERIVNDIKTFYRTGSAPQPSVVGQFHYSRANVDRMDVQTWMEGLDEYSLRSEDERELLKSYKNLRMKIKVSQQKQLDYRKKIQRLEASKEVLTPAERSELIETRNRLDIEEGKYARLETQLYEVTDSEGYASMMYYQNQVLNDFLYGRTQAQVDQTVSGMLDEVKKMRGEIAKQAEELKALSEDKAVRTVKSRMAQTQLREMAQVLQNELSSRMGLKEVESRLAEIALKNAQGKDVTADCEALARDMADKARGMSDKTEELEAIRGTVFVIGPKQLEELHAMDSTLKEVNQRLRGSGVRVKSGQVSEIERQWRDLRESNMGLPELYAEGDMLETVVSWVESQMNRSAIAEYGGFDASEYMPVVLACATAIQVEALGDETDARQARMLMSDVKALIGKTENIAENMQKLQQRMDALEEAGHRAAGWTGSLSADVNMALEYYNKTARQAAQEERRKVKEELIKSLQSDHAKELVAQEQKFRDLMRQDRDARNLRADNDHLRSQIHTLAKRMATLLTKETDLKNIPEQAKPLARYFLKMIVDHDLYTDFRRVTLSGKEGLKEMAKRLKSMEMMDGEVDLNRDLEWLVVGEGENRDEEVRDTVISDLIKIEQGLLEWDHADGLKNISLADRKAALLKIREGAAEIMNVINRCQQVEINGRMYQILDIAQEVHDGMAGSRFKGELTGDVGRKMAKVKEVIGYGNTTPEYFFRNLRNKALSMLHGEMHRAENRNGLLLRQAQKSIAKIVEETGAAEWDMKQKVTLHLESGQNVEMTLGQVMGLWATWNREKMNQEETKNGVEQSFHLKTGGFYVEQENSGKGVKRELIRQRAHKVTDNDMTQVGMMLTPAQLEYVERMVGYLSKDMSDLGNEASMRMYGIKKYKEAYYYPFKIWEGVRSVKSDAGAGGTTENRIAHSSFSKRRVSNASNALVIGDFTETVANHVVQMINYNTFAPAIEGLNKVMNTQLLTRDGAIGATKRNVWAAFGEAYGRDALGYLQTFLKDLNGGVTQDKRKTLKENLLSVFKKNAVAGSMSVAAQQPLSYIRAAMLINPKYLSLAINPKYWKGSHEEMLKYSGVAVIKEMGRFDMGYGQSAREYLMPEGKVSKARAVGQKISEYSTILPEKMDQMTWTRMWTACKLEQQALNPGMDIKSDAFLEKVAERFNEVMRRTQVYDSVLVKSSNMRSQNFSMKALTSFMAEPTLTINVLADAYLNRNEKGGKLFLAKAIGLFLMSATAQAAVKGFFGAGRSPDEKKTKAENFWYRFWYNFISEVNPLGLIPGYNDAVELLANGELKDDAAGVVGKALSIFKTIRNMAQGKGKGAYRDIEDSLGQLLQLATNVPMKNIMRDGRAMFNWFSGQSYADRETSGAVLKYQTIDLLASQDLLGLINGWLGDAGYGTSSNDYYQRIYEAKRDGRAGDAKDMSDYMVLAKLKGKDPDKTLQQGVAKAAKSDPNASAADTAEILKDEGADVVGYAKEQYREGNLSHEEATRILKEMQPKKSDDEIWWQLDREDYYRETGVRENGDSRYYRLYDGIEDNSSEKITQAVKNMTGHGMTNEQIKSQIGKKYKSDYLELKAASQEQIRMKDALIKAYKATGMTESEAEQLINSWKKKEGGAIPQGAAVIGSNGLRPSGLRNRLETDSGDRKDTTGQYGKGTIDLNNRQVVHNADGSISTERSFSFYDEDTGKEVLIPTVVGGRILTEDEAIDHYYDTVRAGRPEYLGMFDTPEEATEYAERLHNRQDWYYHNH